MPVRAEAEIKIECTDFEKVKRMGKFQISSKIAQWFWVFTK